MPLVCQDGVPTSHANVPVVAAPNAYPHTYLNTSSVISHPTLIQTRSSQPPLSQSQSHHTRCPNTAPVVYHLTCHPHHISVTPPTELAHVNKHLHHISHIITKSEIRSICNNRRVQNEVWEKRGRRTQSSLSHHHHWCFVCGEDVRIVSLDITAPGHCCVTDSQWLHDSLQSHCRSCANLPPCIHRGFLSLHEDKQAKASQSQNNPLVCHPCLQATASSGQRPMNQT